MLSVTLLAAFAAVVSASPAVIRDNLVSLRLSKTVNVTSGHEIIKSDRMRVQRMLNLTSAKEFNLAPRASDFIGVLATNQAIYYTAMVGVGSPATECEFFMLWNFLALRLTGFAVSR
jgi:cathepsin E